MDNIFTKWVSWVPYFQSLLRVVAALVFITYGTAKLFAFPTGMPPDSGTVELFSQMGLAGIIEVFGGILLLVGFFARPVAFILALEMAVAYFQVHLPQSFWPTLNMGVPALLFFLIFLYFSSAGAGPWSIDNRKYT